MTNGGQGSTVDTRSEANVTEGKVRHWVWGLESPQWDSPGLHTHKQGLWNSSWELFITTAIFNFMHQHIFLFTKK